MGIGIQLSYTLPNGLSGDFRSVLDFTNDVRNNVSIVSIYLYVDQATYESGKQNFFYNIPNIAIDGYGYTMDQIYNKLKAGDYTMDARFPDPEFVNGTIITDSE